MNEPQYRMYSDENAAQMALAEAGLVLVPAAADRVLCCASELAFLLGGRVLIQNDRILVIVDSETRAIEVRQLMANPKGILS